MKEKIDIKVKQKKIKSITCDICNKTTENPAIQKKPDYNNEFDEYVSFNVNAGYNSKFLKDGLSLSFDICEECFCKKMLPLFNNVTIHPTFNYSEKEIENMTIDDI